MDTTRRAALAGALGIGAAAVGRPVLAGADPLADRARRWEDVLRTRTQAIVAHFDIDPEAPPAAEVEDVARGAAALGVFKDWAEQPHEAQGAAPMQALLGRLLDDLHAGLATSRRLMRAWLEGDDDTDGMTLRGALAATRLGLRDLRGGGIRGPELESALAELEDTPDGPALRRRCRRMVRQLDRLDEIGRQVAADPSSTGVLLAPSDAHLPAPDPDAVPIHGHPWSAGRVSTALLLGLVGVGGAVLYAVTVCDAICFGGPIVLAVAGLALVGLASWGIARTMMGAIGEAHNRHPAVPDPDATGGRLVGWKRMRVRHPHATPLTIFRFYERFRYQFIASGRLQAGPGWSSGPAGDGVAAGPGAPLPGAPRGALIMRGPDGDRVVGHSGWLGPGVRGFHRFIVNVPAGQRPRGGYALEILISRPERDGEQG